MKKSYEAINSSINGRRNEASKFGFYIFCAAGCFAFTFNAIGILLYRGSLNDDFKVMMSGAICAGIIVVLFFYFSIMRNSIIMIKIMKIWTITFLTLQAVTFVAAGVLWMHYKTQKPILNDFDSFLAGVLSLIGLFFGGFGVVRGIRHRWFVDAIRPGYLKGQ